MVGDVLTGSCVTLVGIRFCYIIEQARTVLGQAQLKLNRNWYSPIQSSIILYNPILKLATAFLKDKLISSKVVS